MPPAIHCISQSAVDSHAKLLPFCRLPPPVMTFCQMLLHHHLRPLLHCYPPSFLNVVICHRLPSYWHRLLPPYVTAALGCSTSTIRCSMLPIFPPLMHRVSNSIDQYTIWLGVLILYLMCHHKQSPKELLFFFNFTEVHLGACAVLVVNRLWLEIIPYTMISVYIYVVIMCLCFFNAITHLSVFEPISLLQIVQNMTQRSVKKWTRISLTFLRRN